MKKNPISGLQFRFWTIWCKQCAMVCIFTTLQCTLMAVHIHIILVYSLLTYLYLRFWVSLDSQLRVELSLKWRYLSSVELSFWAKIIEINWELTFFLCIFLNLSACPWSSPPGTFHTFIGTFSYFIIRFYCKAMK